jgi:serine/threonine protein phosphatase PrpC
MSDHQLPSGKTRDDASMRIETFAPHFERAPAWIAGRRECDVPISLEIDAFSAAMYSSRGRNYRDFNEDSAFLFLDEGGALYAAVLDQAGGLGGKVRGEGSEIAARTLAEGFVRIAAGNSPLQVELDTSFALAHQRLRERRQREVTTAVSVVVRGSSITIANLGDSGALLINESGVMCWRSERHQFRTMQGQSDLTYALGRFDWHPPDITDLAFGAGARILLGTDGFFDNLGDDETLGQAVRTAVTAADLFKSLVARALNAMESESWRGDNLSAVAIHLRRKSLQSVGSSGSAAHVARDVTQEVLGGAS